MSLDVSLVTKQNDVMIGMRAGDCHWKLEQKTDPVGKWLPRTFIPSCKIYTWMKLPEVVDGAEKQGWMESTQPWFSKTPIKIMSLNSMKQEDV